MRNIVILALCLGVCSVHAVPLKQINEMRQKRAVALTQCSADSILINVESNWIDNETGDRKMTGVCKFKTTSVFPSYYIKIEVDKYTYKLVTWIVNRTDDDTSGRLYITKNIWPNHNAEIDFRFELNYLSNPPPNGTCTINTDAPPTAVPSSTTTTSSPTTTTVYTTKSSSTVPTSTHALSTTTSSTVAPTTAAPTTTTKSSTTQPSTTTSSTVSPSTQSSSTSGPLNTKYDYSQVLHKSILFYEAQRSGKLPASNRIDWRGDSALSDSGINGEDLTGGWYDAGDGVKFNFPMASTTTLLALGLSMWKDAYNHAGELQNMYGSVKWPLDYLMKCWREDEMRYYAQVGDGDVDHGFWGRPEDMTMARPAFFVNSSNGGSDVAGEAAAAMAAGTMAFKTEDIAYSNELLDKAKSLYSFAKKYQKKYTDTLTKAQKFYKSFGFRDELCESAILLHMATGDQTYLNDAESFFEDKVAWALSWDDKAVLCQVLLYKATKKAQYKDRVEQFIASYMPNGNIQQTPCGLAWRDTWGSLRYSANAAYIAILAADSGFDKSEEYKKWAMSQIHYMLGDNTDAFSYVIGFGNKYPQKPHHRTSSCPDLPESCGWDDYHSSSPNPQLLEGALVGGPDVNDFYKDERNDYIMNEVACDYNSGFQSSVAGLLHFAVKGNLPSPPTPRCHQMAR